MCSILVKKLYKHQEVHIIVVGAIVDLFICIIYDKSVLAGIFAIMGEKLIKLRLDLHEQFIDKIKTPM